jgi:hypothetical protein
MHVRFVGGVLDGLEDDIQPECLVSFRWPDGKYVATVDHYESGTRMRWTEFAWWQEGEPKPMPEWAIKEQDMSDQQQQNPQPEQNPQPQQQPDNPAPVEPAPVDQPATMQEQQDQQDQ